MIHRITLASILAALLSINLAGCASFAGRTPSLQLGQRYDSETQFNVARLHERQGQLTQARELYEKILKDEPKNSDACHRLAVISTRLGDVEQATDYFHQSLALDPQNTEVLADLGYALHLQGDIGSAEEALQMSLDLDPDNQRTIGNLALVVGMSGRFNESLSLYRRIVSEAEAQANLGYIYVQRGEGDHAIERYDRALTLDDKLQSAANALVKLAELKEAKFAKTNTNTLLQVADKPAPNDDQPATSSMNLDRGQTSFAAFAQDSGEIGWPVIQSSHRIEQVTTTDPASSGSDPQAVRSTGVSATELSTSHTAAVQDIGAPLVDVSPTDFELPYILNPVPARSGD